MPETLSLFEYDPRVIVKAEVRDQGRDFCLTFDDNTTLTVIDDAQYCCEHRYMNTDDDPEDLIGARLQKVILKDASGGRHGGYDCKDIQFVEVRTDKGSIILKSYNIHNGYYGGFELVTLDSSKGDSLPDQRKFLDSERQADYDRYGN